MKKTKKLGRRTKLTQVVQKTIVEALALGLNDKDACIAAGISENTFYEWLGRANPEGHHGRAFAPIYAIFAKAIEKARVLHKAKHLRNVQNAGVFHWQASAWMLERRYPEEYAKRERIDIGNADEKPFKAEVLFADAGSVSAIEELMARVLAEETKALTDGGESNETDGD